MQSDQAIGDAGDEVSREIVPRVATQALQSLGVQRRNAMDLFCGRIKATLRACRRRFFPGHLEHRAATSLGVSEIVNCSGYPLKRSPCAPGPWPCYIGTRPTVAVLSTWRQEPLLVR